MQNKICVYAICKNESKFVDKWLDSMSEADYIVVLDTGSTDGTYEMLKDDPRVHEVEQKVFNPFRFDFARNESLKLVPDDANILLCTDFDEVLDPGWADIIRQNWSSETKRGYYKYIWDHTSSGNPGTIFKYDKLHTRDYKWYYPVHEVLGGVNGVYDIPEASDIDCTINFQDYVTLHHYPDQEKSRSNYIDLLELRVKETPEDSYGFYLLGREYGSLGEYEKSIETFDKTLDLPDIQNRPLLRHSVLGYMGDIYNILGDISEAILCYNLQIQYDQTYREPYVYLAEIYLRMNLYDLAIGYIKESLNSNKVFRHYDWSERSEVWNEKPYDILSLAYSNKREYEKAAKYALQALKFSPLDKRLQDNYLGIVSSIELKGDK